MQLPFYRGYTIGVDLLCWIDIVMNFFIGFVAHKPCAIVLNHSKIARKYVLNFYFICDILSSIPKGILYYESNFSNWYQLYGVVSFFSLFKIVRLVTLNSCINKTARYFHIQSKGILFLLCSLIMTITIFHWMACLQLAVPRLIRFYFARDANYDSWIYTTDILSRKLYTQYINCFFRSSAFILGIRLSIYKMILPEDYALAIITYLLGKLLVAFIWISLAVAILHCKSMDIKLLEILNQLDEYMKRKEFPSNLSDRVSKYYNSKYQQRFFREEGVENALSRTLKSEVHMHVCKSLIKSVSIFSDLSTSDVSKVVEHLTPEIFLPNDTIINSDTYGDAMYFLSSGTVAVFTRSGKEVCHLQEGAYFGEISLIIPGQRRIATVMAIEACQIYKLKKKDFNR
ncbi:hypothetical protein NQ314_002755 [Rhamnusium bicolor]|uniref:Cyclic nucleotide-binding domain-containing protein n=1 Tax=Rhamnusium bicolor TaxID=1586634 RepID=A0AAV8ZR99_9CUCU|nr:hypothetical protein NQ314_002755 [Rhamnusium bicolor]